MIGPLWVLAAIAFSFLIVHVLERVPKLFGAEPITTVPPERILPTDVRMRCPTCESDRPVIVLADMHSHALRDGALVEEKTGRRVACQDCGAVFSIGPHGKFRQHRDAQPPWSDATQATRRTPGDSVGAPTPQTEDMPPVRTPLERPRV